MEIATAAQDEGLVDGILQTVVGVLSDAVFMAFAAIDTGGAEVVVVQQGAIPYCRLSDDEKTHFTYCLKWSNRSQIPQR